MIHVLSPRRGPLCRSSGCGCDHRDVSYHRNHLADETTDCRWRNYRPGNTPYNSMSYKTSVVYDNLYLLQLFYLGLLQIGLEPSILYNSVHLYKIICCIYKVLLKYVYIQSTITYYSSSGSFAVETIFHGLQFVARPLFYARPKLRTISIVGQVITANSLRSLQKTIDNSYIYSSNTAQIWEGRNRQYEFNMQRYGKKIASQDVQNFYSHLREEHSSTNPPFLLVIGSISHKGTSVCLLSPPSCIVYQRTKDELL